MKAREHTLSMIQWWQDAGVDRADLAVRRPDGTMLWHRDVPLKDLPLPWAGAENLRRGEVYVRPARGFPWPVVFLDDVPQTIAARTAGKYESLVVKTSEQGGCHVWLSCTCALDEWARHQAQRWLAARAGADPASTSGEHLGRLAGFKNWKRGGTWVNVLHASHPGRRWVPRADEEMPIPAPVGPPAPTPANQRPSSPGDTTASGVEWGWVCGMLEAGLPPRTAYYRLIERARRRRGSDAERYAQRTIRRALPVPENLAGVIPEILAGCRKERRSDTATGFAEAERNR